MNLGFAIGDRQPAICGLRGSLTESGGERMMRGHAGWSACFKKNTPTVADRRYRLPMIFKSLCRHAEIGANSYLIETDKARVVLDAGMHPKHEGEEAIPHYEFLEDNSVDSIVVTHSHLDHVGTLPVFLQRQRQAKVFMSAETADLASAMLHNSVNVMQSKREELGIVEYPLFDHDEIDEVEERIESPSMQRVFDLDFDGNICATFYDAGHILGSVGVMIEADGKRLFYTGDVNFESSTLQKGAQFPVDPVDALIVETTRGAQERRADYWSSCRRSGCGPPCTPRTTRPTTSGSR